jgi:hypothetical protein
MYLHPPPLLPLGLPLSRVSPIPLAARLIPTRKSQTTIQHPELHQQPSTSSHHILLLLLFISLSTTQPPLPLFFFCLTTRKETKTTPSTTFTKRKLGQDHISQRPIHHTHSTFLYTSLFFLFVCDSRCLLNVSRLGSHSGSCYGFFEIGEFWCEDVMG